MTGQLLSKSTKYIVFTQDDDLAPSDIKWYIDAKKYFLKYPELAMIGLNGGGLINFKKNQYYDFSRNRINDKNFYFCSWLKTGPLIINKSRLQEIGGWKMFSKIGESDHFADIDLSLRFCMSGYSIGLLLNNNALKWERRFSRDDGFDKHRRRHDASISSRHRLGESPAPRTEASTPGQNLPLKGLSSDFCAR